MIGPADEYFMHQIVAPANKVASKDRNWQDRFYFNFIDPAKSLSGILAMGFFPNMNLFQGVLNIAREEKLICKNYFRQMGADRLNVNAGSMRVDIVEPLEKWNLNLDEPDLDIAMELLFTGRSQPYEFDVISWQDKGETVWDQCHYTQAGEFTGTLKQGDLKLDKLVGIRDRSWGIRNMARLDFWIWISANFDNSWLTAWLGQTADGEIINVDGALCPDNEERDKISSLDYEIEFLPSMRTPESSSFAIETASGRKLNLKAKALHTIYVSIHNGILDLADKKVLEERDRTTQIFDQTQTFDLEGQTGLGMVEFFVMGGCKKYPETWRNLRA
jgi:hypothetical protein